MVSCPVLSRPSRPHPFQLYSVLNCNRMFNIHIYNIEWERVSIAGPTKIKIQKLPSTSEMINHYLITECDNDGKYHPFVLKWMRSYKRYIYYSHIVWNGYVCSTFVVDPILCTHKHPLHLYIVLWCCDAGTAAATTHSLPFSTFFFFLCMLCFHLLPLLWCHPMLHRHGIGFGYSVWICGYPQFQ